jgi:hypothetical protein
MDEDCTFADVCVGEMTVDWRGGRVEKDAMGTLPTQRSWRSAGVRWCEVQPAQ